MPTEARTKKGAQPWFVVAFIAIVLAFFAWNIFAQKENPDEPPLVTSPKQSNDELVEAYKLSIDPLHDFENGVAPDAVAAKNLKRAALLFDGISAYQPQNFGPYVGAAKCYQAIGADEDAVKRIQKGLAAVPVAPDLATKDTAIEAHYVLSVSLFNLHRYPEALKEIETAIAMLPIRSPIYLAQKARIELQTGHYPEASHDVAAALKLDPGNGQAQAIFKLASLTAEGFRKSATDKLNKHDYKGVVADADRGLELISDYPPLLALRGAAHIKLGDKAGAEKDIKALRGVDPNSKDARTLEQLLK